MWTFVVGFDIAGLTILPYDNNNYACFFNLVTFWVYDMKKMMVGRDLTKVRKGWWECDILQKWRTQFNDRIVGKVRKYDGNWLLISCIPFFSLFKITSFFTVYKELLISGFSSPLKGIFWKFGVTDEQNVAAVPKWELVPL